MSNLNSTRITQSYSEEISINSNTATFNMERFRVTNMMTNQEYWQLSQIIPPVCGPPNMAAYQGPPAAQYPHFRMCQPIPMQQHFAIASQVVHRPIDGNHINPNNTGGFATTNNDLSTMPTRPMITPPTNDGYRYYPDDAFSRSRDTSPASYETFLRDAERTAINSNEHLDVGSYNEKVKALTVLGLRGSELAEKLAHAHRNRPCFKKIDSLCARMKQDLIRPDGVLPNINSQGTAWAVKDFIFVFTRIMNAWIIIKGYVYNTPEGLNKVKGATSTDFAEKFSVWQDATADFIESLIKSFVSLDELVQSQKSAFQRPETPVLKINKNSASKPYNIPEELNNYYYENTYDLNGDNMIENNCMKSNQAADLVDNMNRSYRYTLIEDSEESQRNATTNGTYFKTGTYNPIQKEYNSDSCDGTGISQTISISTPPLSPESISTQSSVQSSTPPSIPSIPSSPSISLSSTPQSSPQYVPPVFSRPIKILTRKQKKPKSPIQSNTVNLYHLPQSFEQPNLKSIWTYDGNETDKTTPTEDNNEVFETKNSEPTIKEWISYEFPVVEHNLTNLSSDYDPNIVKPLSNEIIELFNILISRLIEMKHGYYFLNSEFITIYFPQFIYTHRNIKELRYIIVKCQYGGYKNLYEVVHDLKTVCYEAKSFLKFNIDHDLTKAVTAYENELDEILKEPPFKKYGFSHITGHPNDVLNIEI